MADRTIRPRPHRYLPLPGARSVVIQTQGGGVVTVTSPTGVFTDENETRVTVRGRSANLTRRVPLSLVESFTVVYADRAVFAPASGWRR